MWAPADTIRLIEVLFYGVAIICVPVATLFTMVSAARSKRAWQMSMLNAASIKEVSTKVDGMLAQRDAAKFDAGERKGVQSGVDTAAILAEGQRQGREQGREQQRNGDQPLPVADDRTAVAAERSATATERVATATEDKA